MPKDLSRNEYLFENREQNDTSMPMAHNIIIGVDYSDISWKMFLISPSGNLNGLEYESVFKSISL